MGRRTFSSIDGGVRSNGRTHTADMEGDPVQSLRFLTTVLCLSLFAAAASGEENRCSERFPDFNCDDRQSRYEGFIPPTSMPYLFEDPFITTEISAHAIWHDFPWDSVFRGGDAWVAAIQARLAITDRLAFIASKDGYTWLRPGSNSQISADQGFFDITAGFKYALIDRPEDGFIFTPALRVDLPVGQKRVFSGNGGGVVIPSVSSAYGMGPVHLIGSTGWRLPFSSDKESTSIFYNLHLDVAAVEFLVPFLELNGTTWTHSGHGERRVKTKAFGSVPLTPAQDVVHNQPPAGLGQTDRRRWEGADVVNLGSRGVAGNTILTLAAGARIPVGKNVSFGAYYEFPLTDREDIFGQRVDLNAMYTF
jgi:hypothetical protein